MVLGVAGETCFVLLLSFQREPWHQKTYRTKKYYGSTGPSPYATLEERAEAFRVIPQAVALEVCGKRERRREEGWFAAAKEPIMALVAQRNAAEV